jgi:hypothetical protein
MNRFTKLLLSLGAAAALSTSAFAGYTTIQTDGEFGGGAGVSNDGSGYELPAVLANYYAGVAEPNGPGTVTNNVSGSVNGTLTITGGTLGTNTVTLVRQLDTGGTSTYEYLDGSTAGTANDSTWHDGTAAFNLDAIVAGNNQTFGYMDTATNLGVTVVANASAGQSGSLGNRVIQSTDPFVWFDSSGGSTFFSNSADNSNTTASVSNTQWGNSTLTGLGSAYTSEDHMATYEVFLNGQSYTPGTSATWLLCWEDTPLGSADADYNDLVVQISATLVPVPASVWMGLVTLAGMGAVLAFRRRQMA